MTLELQSKEVDKAEEEVRRLRKELDDRDSIIVKFAKERKEGEIREKELWKQKERAIKEKQWWEQ